MKRRLLAMVASVAVVSAALMMMLSPAEVVRAQTVDPPEPGARLIGSVPVPGEAGTLMVASGGTSSTILESLRGQACEPEFLAVEDEDAGDWAVYIRDAPSFVNVRFTAIETAESPMYVRCLSEIEVMVPQGDHVLAGTLSLPALPPPYPATIMVSGSGPQDRDEAIEGLPGYEPFRWLSEHLTDEGIAVLRYDDRGVGESTGQHEGAITADFADDAEAAFEFLRAQPGIDALRVGLTGHSEGGIISAMVAARNEAPAFVVSIAGVGLPGDELLELQSRLILEAMGLPPEAVEAELALAARAGELTEAGQWDELEALLREVGASQLEGLSPEERATIDFETLITEQLVYYQTWMQFFLSYDPADDWSQVTAPVLALFGGRDLQVPAEENRATMEAALAEAGNDDVTVEVFPTANHLFQDAVTGSPQEYPDLPMEFVPAFEETISGWVLEHVSDP